MKDLEQTWHEIVKKVGITFRLTVNEREQLSNNRVAKLIGAIPYLAGCTNPERSAIGNVCSYLVAKHSSMRTVFDHCPGDDIKIGARLSGIGSFEDGSRAVIERGMNILYLTMVCNYQKDRNADTALGKYNPLSAGVWNYEVIINKLLADIAKTPCPEMDRIFGVGDSVKGFWDPSKPNEGKKISAASGVHDPAVL